MMPRQLGDAQFFFEGMGASYIVPWKAWLLALVAWQPFIWSLFLVMIAIMVVLRRQWIDNERLVYPLVQVPLAMTAMGEANGALSTFFQKSGNVDRLSPSPPLGARCTVLYAYFPEGVHFARGVDLFHQTVPIMRGTTSLHIIFRFHILGFFLLPQDRSRPQSVGL